jgi:hypothetical protein
MGTSETERFSDLNKCILDDNDFILCIDDVRGNRDISSMHRVRLYYVM